MNTWLISPESFAPIAAAIKNCVSPTAEQMAQFNALYDDAEYPGARIMTKAGNTAQINITGVLSKEPSWMLRFFGGGNTAYSEIMSAIAEAERDPNIEEIIFTINSPGGQTSGLTEVMDAIKYTTKQTSSIVDGMAASAAYGLASQTKSIAASSRGALIGSVGIKATYYTDENEVSVTSTNAPEKAPDPTTEDGREAIRKTLDAIEAIFIEDIADGRGTSVEKVKANFGRGGVYVAKDALNHGMIDSIIENPRSQVPGATQPTPQGEANMDLQELKSKHPEAYHAAFNEGVAKERDRVGAHLTMGDASGDMKTAVEAVTKGDELTAGYQAKYMAAGMRNGQIGARQTDDATTAAATAAITPNAAPDTTAFNSGLAEELGVETNG